MRDLWLRFRYVICSVALVCLLVVLHNVLGSQILHVDYFAYRFFVINVRQGWLTPIMQSISELAVPSVLVIVLVTILAFAPGRRPALTVVLNFVGVILLSQIFGFFVHGARPDGYRLIADTGYHFPSSHAMIAAAFYGLLAWVVWRYEKDRVVRAFSTCAYALVAIMVGVSRVYLGAHYASDVIAGFCLSLAWIALFTVLVAPYVLPRRRTSLGINDVPLGAADKRDRRRRKPRHFRTTRHLFAMSLRRAASKLSGASADAKGESRSASTPRRAAQHSSRVRPASASSGEGNQGAPNRRHSSDVVTVIPTVEPSVQSRTAMSSVPQVTATPTTAQATELRATTTMAANAAAAARRSAASTSAGTTGAFMSPNATGPIGPGTSGAFMARPGTSGPMMPVRSTRANSTGGLRPSATGPIPTVPAGRRTSPNTTGSFAPVSSGTNMARRKVKPNTTGAFAVVRTVRPGTSGSLPQTRKGGPNPTGSLGPAPAAASADPVATVANEPAAETPKAAAPKPAAPKAEKPQVVEAENVHVEDKVTEAAKADE